MTIGSLFSGIGGLDLGLERAGFTVAWQSEINPFARSVLQKHWPGVPLHGDVRLITAETVPAVDVLVGGFPCQDISQAGKGEGLHGERSGLWFEFRRLIQELRPRYVLIENVPRLRGRGLHVILSQLATDGYDAEWDCIPASRVGAPHRRDRLFIVGYPAGEPVGVLLDGCGAARSPEATSEGTVHTCYTGCNGSTRLGWLPEPAVGRVVDGVPGRMDRMKALGNAVVPQVAEHIGRGIMSHAHRR